MSTSTISFTLGSIVVMVIGLDKVLPELETANSKPYLQTDLLWLIAKTIKNKSSRETLIKTFGLSSLVNQIYRYIK